MTLVAAVDSRDAQHPSDQLGLEWNRRRIAPDAGPRCMRRLAGMCSTSAPEVATELPSIGLDDLTGDWQAHPVAPRVPQRVPGPYAWTER